jgi:NAD(P)-dependent dehydrogenase (short-subunit alcohol dehydrogenase family)
MSQAALPFAGRRALVTGANSGIGLAIAQGLRAQGADLVLHHFGDPEGAARLARDCGAAPVIEADFTQAGAARHVAGEVARLGGVDILIANAAIERRAAWQTLDEATMGAHVSANFQSLITLTQALLPGMMQRGWGRVVAMGSILSARPRAETLAYAAMKAAQRVAIMALAREAAPHGVTMNVVSPGAIEVEKNAARYADPVFRQAVVAKIPAGRQGQPQDVAAAVLFLCSNEAAYITGADLPVDGGWSIGDPPGMLPGEARR